MRRIELLKGRYAILIDNRGEVSYERRGEPWPAARGYTMEINQLVEPLAHRVAELEALLSQTTPKHTGMYAAVIRARNAQAEIIAEAMYEFSPSRLVIEGHVEGAAKHTKANAIVRFFDSIYTGVTITAEVKFL